MTNSTTNEVMPFIIGEGELNTAESERIRKLLESAERDYQELNGIPFADVPMSCPESIANAQKYVLMAVLALGRSKKFKMISVLIGALKEIRL